MICCNKDKWNIIKITHLLWSTVRDSFEAQGEVFSNGASILVMLFEIIALLIFCSASISQLTGSGDAGLDLAVLKVY